MTRPLSEPSAAEEGEARQEARRDVEPCRCKPLCGPSPFEMRAAARVRELEVAR